MKYIAHRGNRKGPNPERENDPSYILEALAEGYECEVDVWCVGIKWFLGHDEPKYPVPFQFLATPGLWLHAKTPETVRALQMYGGKCNWFWHTNESIALTSQGFGWTCDFSFHGSKNVIMIPEISWLEVPFDEFRFAAICNDWVANAKSRKISSDAFLTGDPRQFFVSGSGA